MKNEIEVKGRQEFMGKEIPVVLGGFGKDAKCICDKTIADIHGMETKHVRERIVQNIKRFKEGVDFIDLKQRVGEAGTLEFLLSLGYAKQAITQAEHIYLLSERGYGKLIKIMDTDLAWEIHDQIMDEYFQIREEKRHGMTLSEAKRIELEAKRMRAEAMRLNAQTRAFKEMKEAIPKDKLSQVAVQVFHVRGLEEVAGQNLGDFLPPTEKTYSATEAGNRLGVTSKKIGSLANKNNLKTDEYGVFVMDKSRYSQKEMPVFRYNEKGVQKLKELLKEEKNLVCKP